jgi:hypothetical protein
LTLNKGKFQLTLNHYRSSYTLTPAGDEARAASLGDARRFLRLLACRHHAVYTIPGWFVGRLWDINPGDGEVIIPSPALGWTASRHARSEGKWSPELENQTLWAARQARIANPAAFPVSDRRWITEVSEAWLHVLTRKRRRETANDDLVPWSRAGLTLAMRIAALRLLFSSMPYGGVSRDFPVANPLSVKTLKPWCPRLQALELLAYSDWHPSVTGRLLFPTAVFRHEGTASFEELTEIHHPDGRRLFLHQPTWLIVRERFWKCLVASYKVFAGVAGIRYISLLCVRDEVCRRLRLSPAGFDNCLTQALEEPVSPDGWHVSIETDVREDQRAGGQLERRPVWVKKIRYTLIGNK